MLSLGFIVGGMVVARRGLGRNPLRTLFLCNIVMWTICVVFALRALIVLLAAGMFLWLCLIPAVEAAEQTILQKVVTPERQGRVFGFAQSVEQAASPVTSFLIGPIAQWFFIPFMTTGAGVQLLGTWFGTGTDRGLALLFSLAGLIGLAVTLAGMRSHAYRALSASYVGRGLPQAEPDGRPAPSPPGTSGQSDPLPSRPPQPPGRRGRDRLHPPGAGISCSRLSAATGGANGIFERSVYLRIR